MVARTAIAVAMLLSLLAARLAAAGEAMTFKASDAAAMGALAYGEFTPGTLDRGAIEDQTPLLRQTIGAISLSISTGNDTDCGLDTDPAGALAKPNATNGAGDDSHCAFLAELTITTPAGSQQAESDCGDWIKDTSYCWVEGDVGQFWLRRDGTEGAKLKLVLGPADSLALEASALTGIAGAPPPPVIPRRGIMLDSAFDDAGRAVSDRWLLLPADVVTLALQR